MSEIIRDVAVIGAGVSGLAAAGRLREAGRDVVVLEKSRGVGGRAATRRVALASGVEVPVDHGAQFFTARDPRFQVRVERWQEEGVCFPWSEEFSIWSGGHLHPADPQWREVRHACHDGMSILGKSLAKEFEVIREFQVTSIDMVDGLWWIAAASGHAGDVVLARSVLLSAPLPQALSLVGKYLSDEQRDLAARFTWGPCVALIARYGEEVAPPPWRGIQIRDPDCRLAFIAWDSSRRRTGTPGRVAVLHGSKEFSSRWLKASKEELESAGRELLEEASGIAGAWMTAPAGVTVHRWRYAHPEGPSAPGGFLRAPISPPLFLIGDALNGGRIEGAWLSGVFAAEDLLLGAKG